MLRKFSFPLPAILLFLVFSAAAVPGQGYNCADTDYDCEIAFYTEMINEGTTWEGAYVQRAYAYLAKGNIDLAMADSNTAIRMSPTYVSPYMLRGDIYLRRGQHDLAFADFTRAGQNDPQTPESYDGRGRVYHARKSYPEAIAEYNKAIQTDPHYPAPYNHRGVVFFEKGEYAAALQDFDQAIKLSPTYDDAIYNRQRATEALAGRKPASAPPAWMPMMGDPGTPASRKFATEPSVCRDVGADAAKKAKCDAAIAEYTGALTADPNYARAYQYRGHAYYYLGNFGQAIVDLTSASARGAEPVVYAFRGWAYTQTGQYAEAIADFDKLLQLNKKSAAPYYYRAWTNLFAGSNDAAFADASTYLELVGLRSEQTQYVVIPGFLALYKSKNAAAKAFLNKWLKESQPGAWPTKILQYLNGDITSSKLLASADNDSKLAEAHAFIGKMQALGGARATARIHFKWVKENGSAHTYEHYLAVTELKKLGDPPRPKRK